MFIHGLQKMTLLDYPGHVACTVFLGGCDLRCPFCHNYELAIGTAPAIMDEQELLRFLEKRRGILDGVAITGGEPCLRKDLPELLAQIREMGYGTKLDTNGFHPEMLRTLLDRGLVDYAAVDIKNSPSKYALTAGVDKVDLEALAETIGLLMDSAIDCEFRTTVVKELHTAEDFHWIGGMIYYNPKDKRLNVNKRVGVGSTINAAHPVGKIITVFIVLSLVVTLLAIVWIGMLEALPTKLMLKNDKVVCHQISDDYEIATSDIKSIEFGENVSELKLSRVAGVGMPNLLKGNFIVNGEKGCRVFLNKKAVCYVKIETDERTYYFNGESKSATKDFYESLADALK